MHSVEKQKILSKSTKKNISLIINPSKNQEQQYALQILKLSSKQAIETLRKKQEKNYITQGLVYKDTVYIFQSKCK